MNPEQIKLALQAAAGAALLALAFSAGWGINGWRLHAKVADLKTDAANTAAQQAEVALSDLTEASNRIKQAAAGAQVDMSGLSLKLTSIDRRLKNAPPAPLPPDCRPGPVRLRVLTEAAGAVDQAIARPDTGR